MANTNIGKIATFLVIWKVVGQDFLIMVHGFWQKFIVICIFPIVLVQYWRRMGKPVFEKMIHYSKEEIVDKTGYHGEYKGIPDQDITIAWITLVIGVVLSLI